MWTNGYARDYVGLVRVSEEITCQQSDYWLVAHSEVLENRSVLVIWDWLNTFLKMSGVSLFFKEVSLFHAGQQDILLLPLLHHQ